MILAMAVDGRPIELRLDRDGDRCVFSTGGAPQEASVIAAEPGIYTVLIGGSSYEVKIIPGLRGWWVDVRGVRYEIEVRDPRRFSRASGGLAGEGRSQLAAPMPGKVVRVLVSPGDAVEAGQGLVVVEAMKMQNEMKAPRAGTVVSVQAVPGARVAAGDVLAVLE